MQNVVHSSVERAGKERDLSADDSIFMDYTEARSVAACFKNASSYGQTTSTRAKLETIRSDQNQEDVR